MRAPRRARRAPAGARPAAAAAAVAAALSFRGLLAEHGVPRGRVARDAARGRWRRRSRGPALARLREGLFEPPRPLAERAAADTGVELVTAARRGRRGARDRAPAAARGRARRAVRGDGRGAAAARDLRAALHRPARRGSASRTGCIPRCRCASAARRARCCCCSAAAASSAPAVMEFLTFAPVPFERAARRRASRASPRSWDAISREAGIVSGYEPLDAGPARLRRGASARRRRPRRDRGPRASAGCATSRTPSALLRRVELPERRRSRARGRGVLGRVVERLRDVVDQWIGRGARQARRVLRRDRRPRRARLGRDARAVERGRAGARGALRVGAPAARAARRRRRARGRARRDRRACRSAWSRSRAWSKAASRASLRPDPFLLDAEREALRRARARFLGPRARLSVAQRRRGLAQAGPARTLPDASPGPGRRASPWRPLDGRVHARPAPHQPGPPARGAPPLPPRGLAGERTADPVLPARRRAHAAASGCRRSSSRPPRPRSPGARVAGAELDRMVVEDDPRALPLEDAVDAGERDRLRVLRDDAAAARDRGRLGVLPAVAAREPGALVGQAHALRRPRRGRGRARSPRSSTRCTRGTRCRASRLALYARCGFQYLLQHVLHLEPALEPEERRRIDPLERGDLVPRRGRALPARAARPRRAAGRTTPSAARARLARWPRRRSQGLVEGSPPRFTLLWEREKRRFHETMRAWLATRGGRAPARTTPAHFELSFGLGVSPDGGRAARPRPARDRPGRRARAAGLGPHRPHRPAHRRRARAARLQDGPRAEGRRRQSSAAASSCRSRSTCWRRRSSSRARASRERSSTTWTADGRWRSAPSCVTGPKFKALLRELVELDGRRRLRAGADAPATSATSRSCAGPRACSSAGSSTSCATRRCWPTCGCGTSLEPLPAGRRSGPRARARRDHATSLVLEAGAGTGKTTLLVDRIEALRARGRARGSSEIAAVTFTENAATTHEAAAARAARARARRERAGRRRAGARRGRARGARARAASRRSTRSARQLLQERPLECGVLPGFRMADEAQADALFAEAWEEWLGERLAGGDAVLMDALDRGIPLEARRLGRAHVAARPRAQADRPARPRAARGGARLRPRSRRSASCSSRPRARPSSRPRSARATRSRRRSSSWRSSPRPRASAPARSALALHAAARDDSRRTSASSRTGRRRRRSPRGARSPPGRRRRRPRWTAALGAELHGRPGASAAQGVVRMLRAARRPSAACSTSSTCW